MAAYPEAGYYLLFLDYPARKIPELELFKGKLKASYL